MIPNKEHRDLNRSMVEFNESVEAVTASLERLNFIDGLSNLDGDSVALQASLEAATMNIDTRLGTLARNTKDIVKKTWELLVKAFTWMMDRLADLYNKLTSLYRAQLSQIRKLRDIISKHGGEPYFKSTPRRPITSSNLATRLSLVSKGKVVANDLHASLRASGVFFAALERQAALVLSNNDIVMGSLNDITTEQELTSLIKAPKETTIGSKVHKTDLVEYRSSDELVNNRKMLSTTDLNPDNSEWVRGGLGLRLVSVTKSPRPASDVIPVLDERSMLLLLDECEACIERMRNFKPSSQTVLRDLKRFLTKMDSNLKRVSKGQGLEAIRSYLVHSNKETIEVIASTNNYYASIVKNTLDWVNRSVNSRMEGQTK